MLSLARMSWDVRVALVLVAGLAITRWQAPLRAAWTHTSQWITAAANRLAIDAPNTDSPAVAFGQSDDGHMPVFIDAAPEASWCILWPIHESNECRQAQWCEH